MKHLFLLPGLFSICLTVLTSQVKGAGQSTWMIDYDKARQEAMAGNKDLLINFSGLDWCELCRTLDREVFCTEAFQKAATKPFVLVHIDSPIDAKNKAMIPETLQARNEDLREAFGVHDYPSVFLATADGVPYARTGYRSGGPTAYLRHLDDLYSKKKTVDALVAKSKSPECRGLERARLLDEIITNTNPQIAERYHRKSMQEIIALDADDRGGLKTKYRIRLSLIDVSRAMSSCNFAEAVKLYDAIVTDLEPTGQDLQNILVQKAQAHAFLRDADGRRASLAGALKAAPESRNAPGIKDDLAGMQTRLQTADESNRPQ